MLLSVIIPTYNAKGTLKRCIDSVLRQDIADMEIILVDDGSTDGTGRLCDDYARENAITVIHKHNAGPSEARNAGLMRAHGDLITFIDSDDYIDDGTYEPLVKLMADHPEYDILEYSWVKENKRGKLKTFALPDHEYTDAAEYWIEGMAYAHTYACNKFFRKQLFSESAVRFPGGKKFEDVYILSELLKHANIVRTTSRGLYHYTYSPHGITVTADSEAWRNLLFAHLPLINNKDLRKQKDFKVYYAHLLNIQISTYQRSGKEEDILLPALPYHHTWKLKLLHILGMRNICRLFRLKFNLF